MSGDRVAAIARAVLYEGYVLWPYRRSALKNQHRFTIGGLLPAAAAARFAERSDARFSVLVDGDAVPLDLEVRFLHLVRRQVMVDGVDVDEAPVGGERVLTWDEASEECLRTRLATLPATLPIVRAGGADDERLDERTTVRRTRAPLAATACVAVDSAADGRQRLTVTLSNGVVWHGATRDDALRQSLAAAHVVLHLAGGAFVSPLDDEDGAHDGLWPGLAGEPGERDTVLASPVILGDYPAVAPESPGDLFDGGEVDELLVHSIRALTDDERREIRATDPRVRELLDRSLALGPEDVARLHGAVREQRPART